MKNSDVIDCPDYYRLPCGKFLEDYIFHKNLSFAVGSAVKYMFRAGKKADEPFNKDMEKAYHYCRFMAEANGNDFYNVVEMIKNLVCEAFAWDGVKKLEYDIEAEEAETEGWTK